MIWRDLSKDLTKPDPSDPTSDPSDPSDPTSDPSDPTLI